MGDGLSDGEIQALAQTPDNYLWLGTPHGLVRFDGFHFATYDVADARALQEFGVQCLTVDHRGTLWAGSDGGGLTAITPGGVRQFDTANGLSSLSVRAVHEDSSHTLWAGTEHGIFRLSHGVFTRVLHLGDPSIASIVDDGVGGLWFAGHRLLHFHAGSFTEIEVPERHSGLRIHSLALGPDGALWIATRTGLLERLPDGSFHRFNAAAGDIRSLLVDPHHQLWIGTMGAGLARLDPASPHALARRPLATGRTILASLFDTNGDLWFGTPGGLVRLGSTGFALLTAQDTIGSEYASVLADRDGTTWLSNGRVFRWQHGQAGSVTLPSLGKTGVRALFRDDTGALWAGTLGHGVYRYSHGQTSHFDAELGTGFVRGFLQGPDHAVWIATDSGVAEWHNGTISSFQRAPKAPHLRVYAMANAADGGLWVGTPRGLYLLRGGRFQADPLCSLLGVQRIWSLYKDRRNTLWIGTEDGLYLSSPGQTRSLQLPQPVPTNSAVLSILEDAHGRMLAAEPEVIYRFTAEQAYRAVAVVGQGQPRSRIPRVRMQETPAIFAVARETGAEVSGGLPSTGAVDANGAAWYATHAGLLRISPDDPAPLAKAPPVRIEQVLVDGVAVAGDPHVLRLQPGTRSIQIEASPVVLNANTSFRLRRRLLGLEKDWTDFAPGEAATYALLPAGRYTFQAELLSTGTGLSSAASVELEVLSPVWMRPLALLLYGIVAILATWGIYAFRFRQLSLRFQAVEAERSRVAREMHDTLLQGCIGVSSLLEATVLLGNESQGQVTVPATAWRTTLEYAREQISKTIQEARSAIWDLRGPGQSRNLEAELRSMLEEQVGNSGLKYTLEIDGRPTDLRPSVHYELVMSAREAVFNAVHHANASELLVRLEAAPARLAVLVKDNGKGFDLRTQATVPGHFGLISMQERLKRVEGHVVIHSVPGRGSTVTFTLPLHGTLRRGARRLAKS